MSNKGMFVKVHYTGTLDDGTKFDSSYDRNEPLGFVCMAGQMIPGFDAAVENMEIGQTVNVHIPCEEAYGPVRPELMQQIPASQVPAGMQVVPGMIVGVQGPYGAMPARVAEVTDEFITLDLNHEMAGKDLNFEITLLEVSEATAGCDCGGDCDCDDHCGCGCGC